MKIRQFIRKYRFEVTLVILTVIAVLLLVGNDSNNRIKGLVDQISNAVGNFLMRMLDGILENYAKLTPSDLFAFGLLLLIAFLVFFRIRWRVLTAPQFNVRVCPKCGHKIHRSHRKNTDRFLGTILFIALKRYKCVDRKCGWNGLVTAKSRMVELEPIIDEP